MTTSSSLRHLFLALAISATSIAIAGDDPARERHEMMEGVRDAAKPVGAMLKGEKEFDADTLQRSLATFAKASEKLGDLVPEGSEGGEAAPAIWEDPDGFAAAIQEWSDAKALRASWRCECNRDDPRAQCWLCEPRGDASVSAMTQERKAETQEDASVSAMTPGSTHPNMKAWQYHTLKPSCHQHAST